MVNTGAKMCIAGKDFLIYTGITDADLYKQGVGMTRLGTPGRSLCDTRGQNPGGV